VAEVVVHRKRHFRDCIVDADVRRSADQSLLAWQRSHGEQCDALTDIGEAAQARDHIGRWFRRREKPSIARLGRQRVEELAHSVLVERAGRSDAGHGSVPQD
jgi:hypothetical protein